MVILISPGGLGLVLFLKGLERTLGVAAVGALPLGFSGQAWLGYVSAKFFNILNATKLGKTELQEYEPRETTAILMISKESQRNSSGTFSQGSQRCSSVTKSLNC